ncbi:putative major facilitator, sugar transporter, major facilitator superfamily [Rosa chinensis]|uniref:Putative major facilitator, sugar transporter, major facilitator superfamily n=1 Tax=Rosa chinensis TaxID=74649 RepID=A0A2P6P4Z9_ROSCH|nr:putative major facilitator, sugar transporter, major facilitator superfamily [Rosa chinensis]
MEDHLHYVSCPLGWYWRASFSIGYDTGVISGALLYIREDFSDVDKMTWLQETIVSMAVAGAIFGAAIGGWMNDALGRRKSIFSVGDHNWKNSGWFGSGYASMTSPLYISEASPASVRGALVSTNGFLITGAQFLAYLINLAFTKTPGTWRWLLGVAGVPALVQLGLMWSLPESSRWLYRKNKVDEARATLEKIYPTNEVEVEDEMKALHESVEMEKAEEGDVNDGIIAKLMGAFSNPVVRRGLFAGITVQVVQQFVGINTVMYYIPTIVQFAGFASNQTALALCLNTSGLNVKAYEVMIISMVEIITCLGVLSVVFFQAPAHAPRISNLESTHFGSNYTCPAYVSVVPNPASWNCMTCLKAQSDFCANSVYPFRYRGTCGGIAAVANWSANLMVSETFLTLTHALGSAGTFLLFAGLSLIGLVFIFFLVPETKRLQFEEVGNLLKKGYIPKLFASKDKETKEVKTVDHLELV